MSLAVRLLLALAIVAIFVTAIVGLATREVTTAQVEENFELRINAAVRGAQAELAWESDTLSELLVPLCEHDSFVDSTLLALEKAGGKADLLPPGRGIAIQKQVPAQRKALRLDDLVLVTGDGLVLGANELADVGERRPSFAERLKQEQGVATLGTRHGAPSIEVHCARTSAGITVGLIGSRKVAPILDRVGRAYGVELSMSDPGPDDEMTRRRRFAVKEIAGLQVTASVSRRPLFEALAKIDANILLTGAMAVLLSVALAVFFARGLSQPIVELARQTREVVRGNPKPVRGRGGRELVQLANTFNRTIDELASMRKRLARTERIAARREVARQVAHEIKNPLAPIQAAVETLRRLRARDAPEFDEYFDEASTTVLAEVHRIKAIVQEFSKFARMPPPKFERIDLVGVAQNVVNLHSVKDGPGPQITLRSSPTQDVLADHDQMVQVLTNVLQNAVEACHGAAAPGHSKAEVTVEIEPYGEREVAVRISDNGPGIDAAVLDRLFEPYVSTKPEGTGLGLAICQTIIHEHGGDITAHSSPAGATFEIVVPIDGPPLLEKAPISTN